MKEIRDYENKICLTSSIHQKWHGNWIGGVASTVEFLVIFHLLLEAKNAGRINKLLLLKLKRLET